MVCGPFEGDEDDPDAATNPVAIVEVLSPTTEAWDRGEKFAAYRALPSLRHYALLGATLRVADVYSGSGVDPAAPPRRSAG